MKTRKQKNRGGPRDAEVQIPREKREDKGRLKSEREPWSSGYVEETHVLKVVGLNPIAVYWMDILSHQFVVKWY